MEGSITRWKEYFSQCQPLRQKDIPQYNYERVCRGILTAIHIRTRLLIIQTWTGNA